eukprot:s3183_g2.t1
MDGVWVDNHGWDMDALAERMGSGWTLSWLGHGTSSCLGHGCSGRTGMVGTWMHWQNGWGLGARNHGGWMLCQNGRGLGGCSDGVWVDVIMGGTWMLWQNGWGLGGRYHGWDMDALAERIGSG